MPGRRIHVCGVFIGFSGRFLKPSASLIRRGRALLAGTIRLMCDIPGAVREARTATWLTVKLLCPVELEPQICGDPREKQHSNQNQPPMGLDTSCCRRCHTESKPGNEGCQYARCCSPTEELDGSLGTGR